MDKASDFGSEDWGFESLRSRPFFFFFFSLSTFPYILFMVSHSSTQEHDSYGAFRSQNLDLEWSLDVQPQREMV